MSFYDGGIRLLYAGSGSVANENAYITRNAFNLYSNDPMYVGYMYGTSGSLANNRTNQINKSNVENIIESWYTATFNNSSDNNTKDALNNLLTNYINPSAIYCSDRSVSGASPYDKNNDFLYSSRERLFSDYQESTIAPSYACGATTEGYGHYFEEESNIADKFTGSQTNKAGNTIGNGLLSTSPAALITADEIIFAGGKFQSESMAWYYYNGASDSSSITATRWWWTMSPCGYFSSNSDVFLIRGSNYPGYLDSNYVEHSTRAIRPVISLKANVLWKSGTGAPSSPFEVELP